MLGAGSEAPGGTCGAVVEPESVVAPPPGGTLPLSGVVMPLSMEPDGSVGLVAGGVEPPHASNDKQAKPIKLEDRVKRIRRAVHVSCRQAPVSECGAATGFDCGEPRSLRKMVNTTTHAIAKNSLCQF